MQPQPETKTQGVQPASRAERMSTIRASLKLNPIMTKNTDKVQRTLQRRQRKPSCNANQEIGQLAEETPLQCEQVQNMSGFDEKYEMLNKIGQGSNGLVRKCRNIKEDKIYAVKSMNIDQQHIYFLKRNFITVKNLNHPNIIAYKSLYINRRKHLCNLVMEYLPNPNLLEINIDPDEMRNIAYQIIQGIKYLHQKLICHRDIKPENILYNRTTKNIKIIDFGISKKLVRRHAKQSMLSFTGTLFYQAPEMLLGGGYDERVDLWALGVTLYKLISGVTPFESEYHSRTIENIINKSVKYSHPNWDRYPNFLKDLISRLLKKKIEDRLTAQEAIQHFYFTAGSQVLLSSRDTLTKSLTGDFNLLQLRSNLSATDYPFNFEQIPLPRLNSWIDKADENIERWMANIEAEVIQSDSEELESALWTAKRKNNQKSKHQSKTCEIQQQKIEQDSKKQFSTNGTIEQQ